MKLQYSKSWSFTVDPALETERFVVKEEVRRWGDGMELIDVGRSAELTLR